MKKKLMSNWTLKLISVLFAMVLWLVVVNVDDPVTTRKFKDIPVTLLNANLVSDAQEVYEVLDKSDRVTITVKAKRSVVESLSSSDFRATADFAERISESAIPIQVTATKRSGDIVDIYLQNNTVKISVEKKIHKEIPVELQLSGKTAEGYTVGSTSTNPQVVTIAGPSSVVSKVDKVVVPVDINGASEDAAMNAKGKFCSADGSVLEDKRIEGDISNIAVQVHLLHTKSIDLNLTTEGDPADDYRCLDIQYTPTTITIAGEPEELDKINTLKIPSSELNIEGARENLVKSIDVSRYLPSTLMVCADDEKVIQVTIVISRLDGKEFKIPMSSIGILNTPAGLDTILDYDKTVSVIVKGTSEELSSLSARDIKVAVDIKDKAAGSYNLQADVTVPTGYVVTNKPTVSIVLEATPENTPQVVVTVSPVTPQQPTVTPTPAPTPDSPQQPVAPAVSPTPVVESTEPAETPFPDDAEEAEY